MKNMCITLIILSCITVLFTGCNKIEDRKEVVPDEPIISTDKAETPKTTKAPKKTKTPEKAEPSVDILLLRIADTYTLVGFNEGDKPDRKKVTATEEYHNGGNIYNLLDDEDKNLMLFFELPEQGFSGICATEGDFFGVLIGKDKFEIIEEIFGEPDVYGISDMTDKPAAIYGFLKGTLYINMQEDTTISEISYKTNTASLEAVLMSSEDDTDYLHSTPLSMDFDGDNNAETLELEILNDFPQNKDTDEHTNKPIRIVLKIAGSQTIFESLWNDGVTLHITDFNKNDSYLDLYIVAKGTDMSEIVNIYRYDGEQLFLYCRINIADVSFTYDTNGKIFYKGIDGPVQFDYDKKM